MYTNHFYIQRLRKNAMVKKWLVILVLSMVSLTFSENNSSFVKMKNGHLYKYNVKQVNDWGITFTNNRSVLYKVIDRIVLKDELYANQIKGYIPDIEIQYENELYVLDFNNITIPKVERKVEYLFDFVSFSYDIKNDSKAGDRLLVMLKPRNTNFTTRFGMLEAHTDMDNPQLETVYGYFLGVGYQFRNLVQFYTDIAGYSTTFTEEKYYPECFAVSGIEFELPLFTDMFCVKFGYEYKYWETPKLDMIGGDLFLGLCFNYMLN